MFSSRHLFVYVLVGSHAIYKDLTKTRGLRLRSMHVKLSYVI
jgi:hypothetical protein